MGLVYINHDYHKPPLEYLASTINRTQLVGARTQVNFSMSSDMLSIVDSIASKYSYSRNEVINSIMLSWLSRCNGDYNALIENGIEALPIFGKADMHSILVNHYQNDLAVNVANLAYLSDMEKQCKIAIIQSDKLFADVEDYIGSEIVLPLGYSNDGDRPSMIVNGDFPFPIIHALLKDSPGFYYRYDNQSSTLIEMSEKSATEAYQKELNSFNSYFEHINNKGVNTDE